MVEVFALHDFKRSQVQGLQISASLTKPTFFFFRKQHPCLDVPSTQCLQLSLLSGFLFRCCSLWQSLIWRRVRCVECLKRACLTAHSSFPLKWSAADLARWPPLLLSADCHPPCVLLGAVLPPLHRGRFKTGSFKGTLCRPNPFPPQVGCALVLLTPMANETPSWGRKSTQLNTSFRIQTT